MSESIAPKKILIVGGGYVGMYTAIRLLRKLKPSEATVTVVDPKSYMTYQPFLPEASAGSINSRHACIPLRRVLRKANIITGYVTKVEHTQKRAVVQPLAGDAFELSYDVLVFGPGSVSRTLPVPGLADWGVGFKTVEEAILLNNRVIECLDIAESATDPEIRERNLTFVVVGGGYSGVEALAEMEDMCRYATRYYKNIAPTDLRWVMVEASDHILPEVGRDLGLYAVKELEKRGIAIKLNTRLDSCVQGEVTLSDGTEMLADTLVWTAGVRPSPLCEYTDLPSDDKGRIVGRTTLQVDGFDDAFVAGDCAAIPDLAQPGETCSPSAQHAMRQAKVLANNVMATLRGGSLKEYKHSNVGSVASLGLYHGVANIYGVKMRGLPAWLMHRTYHGLMVPTFARTVQVVSDWTLQLLFRREVVGTWSVHEPFKEFSQAARNVSPGTDATPSLGRAANSSGLGIGSGNE